jgi:FlaA1/EpsC-like NDP-sugar epimerase
MTLAKYNPKKLVIFSRDEMKHWEMAKTYGNDERVRFFVGDVRDKDRLSRALVELITLCMPLPQKLFPWPNTTRLSV